MEGEPVSSPKSFNISELLDEVHIFIRIQKVGEHLVANHLNQTSMVDKSNDKVFQHMILRI